MVICLVSCVSADIEIRDLQSAVSAKCRNRTEIQKISSPNACFTALKNINTANEMVRNSPFDVLTGAV